MPLGYGGGGWELGMDGWMDAGGVERWVVARWEMDGQVVQGWIGVGDMDGCCGDGWMLGGGWRVLAI